MATKARPGGAHEAPPGRPADGGLSEADIPTPPSGVFVHAPSEAPPTRQLESGPSSLAFNEVNSNELIAQKGVVGDGPANGGVTQPVTSLAPPAGDPRGADTPARALDDGAQEWEEVGTAAWDPAAVWDAEDKNELWVKGLGWGAPSETSMWQAQPPSTAGPAVRVGWSAAGWSSAPPITSRDGPDAARSPDDAAPAFVDDFTVAHRHLPDGDHRDAPPERDDQEGRDEPAKPARRGLPWRELVIISAVAVIAAAVVLGVTSARVNLTTSGSPSSTSSPVASGLAVNTGPKTSTPAGVRSSSARAPATSSPATTAPLLNQRAKALPVTPGVEESVIKSWVATNPGGYGIGLADVAGTVPSKAYYAVQPATGTYWAIAAFKPSPALLAQSSTTTGKAELSEFKNSLYAFSWQAGPLWTLVGEVSTGDCPGIWVPRTVLAAWGLCGL